MLRNNYRALMLAAFGCMFFAGNLQAQTYYTDRATFDAAFPGLLTEDLENSNLPNFGQCTGPVDSVNGGVAAAGGACYDPGEVEDGVSLDASASVANNLIFITAGFLGNASDLLFTNAGSASFVLAFAGGSNNGVGLDIYCLNGSTASVDIFGSGGLVANQPVNCSTTGVFFGVDAGQNITGLAVNPGDVANDLMGVDDVSYSNAPGGGGPTFECDGFAAPMANHPVKVKKNRSLPFKMQLFDEGGSAVTDLDLTAAPLIQVVFSGAGGEDPEDVSGDALPAGHGTDGNEFEFTDDGLWQFNLKTNNYSAAGTYDVSVLSGDGAEYTLEPTCESSFVVK